MGLGESLLQPSAETIGKMVGDELTRKFQEMFGAVTNEAVSARVGVGDTAPLLPTVVQREYALERDKHHVLIQQDHLLDEKRRLDDERSRIRREDLWGSAKAFLAGAVVGGLAGMFLKAALDSFSASRSSRRN